MSQTTLIVYRLGKLAISYLNEPNEPVHVSLVYLDLLWDNIDDRRFVLVI